LKAVITGASSGIGRELAKILCWERNNTVLGVGRDKTRLSLLAEELRDCFIPVQADLSRVEGVYVVVKATREYLGEVDLLVNNAGFGVYKKIIEHSVEEVVSLVNVNFIAPLILTKELLNLMRHGSVVVFVVTAGVYVLLESLPLYGASKVALHYAVKALRREIRDRGVHVLAVYPGVVNTEFHIRAGYSLRGGLDPRRVAEEIIKAIEKKKSEVYIPRYLVTAKLLAPILPGYKVPVKTR
jgi:short-subunit dehydrogenase